MEQELLLRYVSMKKSIDTKNNKMIKIAATHLLMKLNIPVAQEQTDGCPYEN